MSIPGTFKVMDYFPPLESVVPGGELIYDHRRDARYAYFYHVKHHPLVPEYHSEKYPDARIMIYIQNTEKGVMEKQWEFENSIKIPRGSDEKMAELGLFELKPGDLIFARDLHGPKDSQGSIDPENDVLMAMNLSLESFLSPEEMDNLQAAQMAILGPRELRSSNAPINNGDDYEGGLAFERDPTVKGINGSRCYSAGPTHQRPRNMTSPTASGKVPDGGLTSQLIIRQQLVKQLTSAGVKAMKKFAPSKFVTIMEKHAELTNMPRIGNMENVFFPAVQLNFAPAVSQDESSEKSLECMLFYGSDHGDFDDDGGAMSTFGFWISLKPLLLMSFSGLFKHGGTPPLSPPGSEPKPWAYRFMSVLYPPRSMISGAGNQSIGFAALPLGNLFELKPEMTSVLDFPASRGVTSEANWANDGEVITDHESLFNFFIRGLLQTNTYFLNQLPSSMKVHINSDAFIGAFSATDPASGEEIKGKQWNTAPTTFGSSSSTSALREKNLKEWIEHTITVSKFIPSQHVRDFHARLEALEVEPQRKKTVSQSKGKKSPAKKEKKSKKGKKSQGKKSSAKMGKKSSEKGKVKDSGIRKSSRLTSKNLGHSQTNLQMLKDNFIGVVLSQTKNTTDVSGPADFDNISDSDNSSESSDATSWKGILTDDVSIPTHGLDEDITMEDSTIFGLNDSSGVVLSQNKNTTDLSGPADFDNISDSDNSSEGSDATSWKGILTDDVLIPTHGLDEDITMEDSTIFELNDSSDDDSSFDPDDDPQYDIPTDDDDELYDDLPLTPMICVSPISKFLDSIDVPAIKDAIDKMASGLSASQFFTSSTCITDMAKELDSFTALSLTQPQNLINDPLHIKKIWAVIQDLEKHTHISCAEQHLLRISIISAWMAPYQLLLLHINAMLSKLHDLNENSSWILKLMRHIGTIIEISGPFQTQKTFILHSEAYIPDIPSKRYCYKPPRLLDTDKGHKEQISHDAMLIAQFWLDFPQTNNAFEKYQILQLLYDGIQSPSIFMLDCIWNVFQDPHKALVDASHRGGPRTLTSAVQALDKALKTHHIADYNSPERQYLPLLDGITDLFIKRHTSSIQNPQSLMLSHSYNNFLNFLRKFLPIVYDGIHAHTTSSDQKMHKLANDPDYFMPFRDIAPTRAHIIKNLCSDKDRLQSAPGFASLLLHRGIFYGSKFALEHAGFFSYLSEWETLHKQLTTGKNAKPLTYFIRNNAYGTASCHRTFDNITTLWNAGSLWPMWLANNPSHTFTNVFNFLKNTKAIRGVGPLIALLIAGDLAIAKAITMPTASELGNIIFDINKGAVKGLQKLGLVSQSPAREEVVQAFVGLNDFLEIQLTLTEKTAMGYSALMLEHGLCKYMRLLKN
ncbi:hypothetical protein C0989_011043 [Termitomyces sp. Mn162]|nr:hypothetical protein C0989_011043 [Termitomyces sp. Mn162]